MPIGVNSSVEPRQQRRNHESWTKTRWRIVCTADHSSFTLRRSMPGVRRIRSIVAAPIRYEREVVGLVEVFSPQPFAFDEGDVAVLERLAQTALLVLRQTQLFKRG